MISLCTGIIDTATQDPHDPPHSALGKCRTVLNFIYHHFLECTDAKRAAHKQGGCVVLLNTSHSPASPPVQLLTGLPVLLRSRNQPGAFPGQPDHLT